MRVTLRLADEVDVSRGDVLVHPHDRPTVSRHLEADLVWLHEAPLDGQKTNWIKHTTQTVRGQVERVESKLNLLTLQHEPARGLGLNEISSGHNFHFTSEVRYWFEYVGGEQLDFTGDDDVWVFVNGRLAVDLGGPHVPENGGVTLDAASSARFGLTDGGSSVCTLRGGPREPSAPVAGRTLVPAARGWWELRPGLHTEVTALPSASPRPRARLTTPGLRVSGVGSRAACRTVLRLGDGGSPGT